MREGLGMKSKIMSAAVAFAMMAAARRLRRQRDRQFHGARAGNGGGSELERHRVRRAAPCSTGWDAEVEHGGSLPTLTLSYFLNKNIAVELFCCFAKLEAEGKGGINGLDLGDFWVFPPALTLQYHFDNFGAFKPYVGAGVQYIHFFSEGNSGAGLGNAKINLDDAFGFTLQAGVDVSIGGGWYLNADIKKTFIDTDASWGASGVTADVDIDPWIYSLGVGYRFNLDDVFRPSRRGSAAEVRRNKRRRSRGARARQSCLALCFCGPRSTHALQIEVPSARRSQYQRTASTISAPMTAETHVATARSRYWSSEVQQAEQAEQQPPRPTHRQGR